MDAESAYFSLFRLRLFHGGLKGVRSNERERESERKGEQRDSSRGKRVGGRGWNAPAKKSRENHESKPLIRVAAGSIGPTNADRWVSMETRICPLGPYVPASSRLSVVGVSATRKAVERERNELSVPLSIYAFVRKRQSGESRVETRLAAARNERIGDPRRRDAFSLFIVPLSIKN